MPKTYIFLLALLVFMFTVQGLAIGGFLSYGLWWLDDMLHFLGGAGLVIFAFWYLFQYKKYSFANRHFWILALGVIGFSVLGGVLWEFFEFSWDYFFARPYGAELAQPTLEDTLSDLFFDMFGAFVAVLYFLYYHLNGFHNSEKRR